MNTTSHSAMADADIDHRVHVATAAHDALLRGEIERHLSHTRISSDFTLMAPFGGPPSRAAAFPAQRWVEHADPLVEGISLKQAAALAAGRA